MDELTDLVIDAVDERMIRKQVLRITSLQLTAFLNLSELPECQSIALESPVDGLNRPIPNREACHTIQCQLSPSPF